MIRLTNLKNIQEGVTYFDIGSVPLTVFPRKGNLREQSVRMVKFSTLEGKEHGRKWFLWGVNDTM